MRDMSGTATGTSLALRDTASAENDARDATLLLQSILQELRDQTLLLGVSFTYLDDKLADLIGHEAAATAATKAMSDAMVAAAAKTDAAAGAGNRAAGMWLGGWRLSANAIHWIIAGTAEYLAVAIPGTIALGLGAFVLYQGAVEQVGERLQALYGTTEATANLFHKTTGDVLGLGHAFQTAQNEANPIAYQLLGAYINGARADMTNFAQAGLQVDRALGELAARMDVDLRNSASEFAGLLSKMVPDLIEFGQILGNIGHAILNLASDMPGLAEVLLKVADGISKVILWISELPHWLVLSFMAFEEFIRWGGLLLGWAAKMVFGLAGLADALGATALASWMADAAGSMQGASGAASHFFTLMKTMLVGIVGLVRSVIGGLIGLGATMVSIAGEEGILAAVTYGLSAAFDAVKLAIFAIPGWGWALAGIAAITALAFWISRSKDAAQELGDSLENAIGKATNVQVMQTLAESIGRVNQALSATPQYVHSTALAFHGIKGDTSEANVAFEQLTATQQKMLGQANQTITGADKISRAYGTDFAQSLGLADVAGVKLANTQITLGKNANIAGQQIENLVQGYKAMDQVGGTLGADMNVMAIQAGLADTKVSGLNQAWDQFINNATGVTSSLAGLNQDLTQVGNTGVQVGKKFEVMSGTQALAINKVAQSLTSFSGTGAQTWQNYDAALQQAEQFTDSLRTAAAYGAVTQTHYTGAIADTVKSLLPFTSHSKTAVEQLSALAQEAGGPATDSYKSLKDWVDKNDESSKEFNKTIQTMTGQLSNAGAAAAEFASTLQSQVQAQIAAAIRGSTSLNSIVGQFQQAVLKAGGQISASSSEYKAMDNYLKSIGLTAQQAKNELRIMQNTIDALHGHNITIGVQTVYSTSGIPDATGPGHPLPAPSYHGMAVGFHSGGVVGGPFGVDRVLAALSAGEAVLNARAVAAIGGPTAVHSLNTKPSHTVLSSGSGGGGGAMVVNQHVTVMLDGSQLGSAYRTDLLTYNRRNPTSNVNLRVR